MNLPNTITFSRLALTAVFVMATTWETAAGHWVALITFVVAAISDFVDGYLARKLGQVTAMGKLLDPLADKVLVSAAYVYLSVLGFCPLWVTVLIIAREFLVTGLRQLAVEAGHVMAADRLGKWKTALQLTFCIACLAEIAFHTVAGENAVVNAIRDIVARDGWVIALALWGSLALTLLSGWNYLWGSRELVMRRQDL
ncbi:MAG: CDP-diacylglycerol--glycerol-3-phosphate 3-phosphatidyltransferase [Verrucomicrobiota bacterium]